MNAPAALTPRSALSYCHGCGVMSEMAEDGTCLECLSIIDLTLWQETEEAFQANARAAEIAERFDPVDPFFASDRALNRGYGSV